MSHRSRFLRVLLLLAPLSVAASAKDLPAMTSAMRPPHLLEVYTSEGCSSCPPAELWLGEMKKEPNLWTEIVPVTYHVDYWDYLGWKDRLSARKHTIRQRQQAAAGKVYTPGFFLNGAEWRGFFDGDSLPPADAPEAGILTVTEVGPRNFVVDFQPKGPEKGPFEVNAALLGMDIEVNVTAGENRGRTLVHDFAALGFRNAPLSPSGGRFTATVPLRNDTQVEPNRLAAAFWVTRPGSFVPVQAVGGYLRERHD